MKNQKAKEEFEKFLKREKHRITPERFEVMDYALQYEGHFGADELYVKMKSENSNISRATVYNTLELLAQCDLLSKRNFGEHKSRYESNYGRKNHDHLICINCGAIKEFTNPKIEKIVEEISKSLGFEVSGYSFNIFGKCLKSETCKNKLDTKEHIR
ncbi:Fur family transcriptional regulator [Melioribacteraceae bacterium 4301-Me]|uniref:Fur family transcriptional regulator n=1 Tax=Pyranulibacter aquaticus TaxID=3163344 RepID=UPI0035971BB1